MPDGDTERLVRGPLPCWLTRRRTVLAPGACLPHDPARWRGALVLVEAGAIELETLKGERAHLGQGAVLWLTGLPLRALHNAGDEPVTLVAIAKTETRTA